MAAAANWACSAMGIKFNCPNGHKLNVKSFLAGRRGICPQCDARFRIPLESGASAEPIHKGDKGGEATQLTAAMQDEYPAAGMPIGSIVAATNYEPAFGSPLGPMASGGALPGADPVSSYSTVAVDPLSEDPQAAWYVRPRSGGQYGPAVGEILRDWIAEGRVAGDSLVWREGWTDWRQASSVFPQLAGLVSAPTLPTMAGLAVGQPASAMVVGSGVPVAGSVPVGGSIPRASGVPLGNIAAGGAIPSGGTMPVLGALPTSGIPSAFDTAAAAGPLGSPGMKKVEIRRRSGNFTALIVILLVVVAIVLVGVFAWVLFGKKEPQSAWRTPSFQGQCKACQTT